ncbi:TIM barrel protein [Antarcticirhabdus aurantiaca]|uniref:TIM barrel protein n=1 Tax=Antarcticirhabdus aurantiaca TaxID=2606717 RepID=A0ACD4NQM4_9HYPH|nr:TIM barrel protein [Antarcticirhabdus aurantiaca]WAJ29153.1 TIM barrel protein [Jeongeuplla avenae]
MTRLSFALNHMAAPKLPLDAFFALASQLGMSAVEIRNDLAGNAIADGTSPQAVRELAERHGLEILSINALYPFNIWNGEREAAAAKLAAYARDCGAKGLVLVPLNDDTNGEDGVRQRNLRQALAGLAPILSDAGVTGLVEPLGFPICSLRLKSEAVEAIGETKGGEVFRLVHDTFHHSLAGEDRLFPELTGLVHISGVEDPGLALDDMLDAHRLLVGEKDRLDNVGQIRALMAAGYKGALSFEPFADEVRDDADIAGSLKRSVDFIEAKV